jgi:hypothetical protein
MNGRSLTVSHGQQSRKPSASALQLCAQHKARSPIDYLPAELLLLFGLFAS